METKGGQILQFVNAETGKRAAIQEFAVGIETDRTTHQSSNGIWYENETALPTVSLAGVKEGFVANTDLVIRTQQLDEKGQKTVVIVERNGAPLELEVTW